MKTKNHTRSTLRRLHGDAGGAAEPGAGVSARVGCARARDVAHAHAGRKRSVHQLGLLDTRHGSHVSRIGRAGRCRARAVRRGVEHAAREPAGSEEPRSQPDGRRDCRGQDRHGAERSRQRVSRRQPARRRGDAPQGVRLRAGSRRDDACRARQYGAATASMRSPRNSTSTWRC